MTGAVDRSPVAIRSFHIARPTLARGTADRSEDLRNPERIAAKWPDARVITVDADGHVAVDAHADGQRLAYGRAVDLGGVPPPGAVLLGSVAGIDQWAVPGVVDGGVPFRSIGPLLSDTEAGLLTTAVAVLSWHRSSEFCPRCGQPSAPDRSGLSRTCPNGHQEFPRTDPAVIVLVHDGADRAVLARQASWLPGRFSVLAGFTEAGEPLEGTVIREVGEEIGVPVSDVAYLGSQPWPFPRSLMVAFEARAPRGAELRPRPGEIEAAQWFSRERVRRLLDSGGAGDGVSLPDSLSIARRMLEGWAAAG